MAWNGIFDDGVFSCGFDMDPTIAQLFNIFTGGSFTNGTTPFGSGYSLQVSGGGQTGKSFGVNLTTVIVGARVFTGTLPSTNNILFNFYDATAGAAQVTLRATSTGSFQFYLGSGTGTPLGSASAGGILSVSSWVYLEVKLTISATVGVVELRVNGNPSAVISASSLNTKSTANTFVNGFVFTGMVANTFFDDWYMLDTTGSSPLNTYLGNVRMVYDVPNNNSAAGSHNQFTPTNPTNVNYTNVGNIPANTAQYNADATVGDLEFYRFPSIGGSPSAVLFLNMWYQELLDTAGTRTTVPGVRSGGSDTFDATSVSPPNGATYGLFNKPWVLDPNTSAAWTVSNAQAAELGTKIAT